MTSPLLFLFMKHSNLEHLADDDIVAKDDSLTFLTHLATEHVQSTFRSGEEKVTKLELLRSFADRIHKHLPHQEANLHPGMKSHHNRPKNTYRKILMHIMTPETLDLSTAKLSSPL